MRFQAHFFYRFGGSFQISSCGGRFRGVEWRGLSGDGEGWRGREEGFRNGVGIDEVKRRRIVAMEVSRVGRREKSLGDREIIGVIKKAMERYKGELLDLKRLEKASPKERFSANNKIHCCCQKSQFHNGSKQIQCTKCGKYQHKICIKKMVNVVPYICFHCQFAVMDLFCIPIETILKPVTLGIIENKNIKFELSPSISKLLETGKEKFRVELRGLQLSNNPFKNSWPNYGMINVDGPAWKKYLTLPEIELSRKRKDFPFDLTEFSCTTKKRCHVISLRKDRTPSRQPKNHDGNCYIIGMFLCRNITINQVIKYYKKYEVSSFFDTMDMIEDRLFPKDKEEDISVVSEGVEIPLTCPLTLGSFSLPARGYKCTHIECFDLENFLKTNIRFRTFKCPFCNKPANILKLDSLVHSLSKYIKTHPKYHDARSVTISKSLRLMVDHKATSLTINGLVDFHLKSPLWELSPSHLESPQAEVPRTKVGFKQEMEPNSEEVILIE
ncbi:unnamed protein product [Moneuplotes crassus]|uniref:SP-RING-type domain-containing protein n=1 Tax=Euplotes crassus TaxID=5936 RepID=A0AAD1Y680_EUPCR|nr:unnamed protein product [Moneuplotes crassus]